MKMMGGYVVRAWVHAGGGNWLLILSEFLYMIILVNLFLSHDQISVTTKHNLHSPPGKNQSALFTKLSTIELYVFAELMFILKAEFEFITGWTWPVLSVLTLTYCISLCTDHTLHSCQLPAIPLQSTEVTFMKNTEHGRPKPCGKLDISGTATTVNTHQTWSCLFFH